MGVLDVRLTYDSIAVLTATVSPGHYLRYEYEEGREDVSQQKLGQKRNPAEEKRGGEEQLDEVYSRYLIVGFAQERIVSGSQSVGLRRREVMGICTLL
jgi:hypothetical protein